MHIKIWSDFACPFCYIGETHLLQALETFEHQDQVTIEYKSYILNPDATYIEGESYSDAFSRLKGIEQQQVEAMLQQVINMAKKAGLAFDFSIAKMTSTHRAHRLFQYAKTKQQGHKFFNRLYRAHFSEGINLDDETDLIQLCKEVGLKQDSVKEILSSDRYEKEVQEDIYQSQLVGVQGVPFYVINDQYAFSGAQPVETFKQVLNDVWSQLK